MKAGFNAEAAESSFRHSPFAIRHLLFAIRHLPFAFCHSPFGGAAGRSCATPSQGWVVVAS